MTGSDPREPSLLRLLYVSSAKGDPSPADLRAILEEARTRNAAEGITGLLLHKDGLFMQFLEGPVAEVEALYAGIGRDSRHTNVRTIVSGPAERRIFDDWSMAFIRLDDEVVGASAGFSTFLEESGQDRVSLGDDVGLWLLRWFRDRGFPSVFAPALAS